MKLLVEYKPNHWKLELITSSSKEVLRSTVPAENLTLAPKVESKFSVDSSDSTKSALAPRHSRRRNLRQGFDTFISYFQCRATQNKVVSEEQMKYQARIKLDTEMRYRRVSELAGFGVEIYQPPVDMTHVPWYKDSTDAELLSPTAELYTDPSIKPWYELDGETSSSTRNTSVESRTQATPAMSPQNISQKSSPISPNTPTAINDMTTFQRNHASSDFKVSPEEIVKLSNPYGIYEPLVHDSITHEIPASISFSDIAPSNFDQYLGEIDPSMLNVPYNENNYQQEDGNNQEHRLPMDPLAFRTGFRDTIALTPHLMALEESAHRTESILGTWESKGGSNWTRMSDHGPATSVDAEAINTYCNELSLYNQHYYSHYLPVGAYNSGTHSKTNPKEQREWLPVKCEHCDEKFTGQYAPGNMKRHSQRHKLDNRITHKCRFCDNSYKRSDALRNHERQRHPNLAIGKPRRRSTRMLGLFNV